MNVKLIMYYGKIVESLIHNLLFRKRWLKATKNEGERK